MLDRDVSKFDPLGVAPHTTYRDEMTELADKPLNDYVKDCFEQGVFPLDRSLVTTTELFHYWRDRNKIKITRERDVAAALQLLSPKPVRVKSCPVKEVGAFVNIWIIRDHDKYKKMSAPDLGKKYQGFYTDSRTADVLRVSKPINKADPYHQPQDQRNMTKAGEVDEKANQKEIDERKAASALYSPDKDDLRNG